MLKALLLILAVWCESAWTCAQFQRTEDTVFESTGFVDVCVDFTAEVTFTPPTTSGQITIQTSIGSQTATTEDFESFDQDYIINQGHTATICARITIFEDSVFEDAEIFNVLVSSNDVDLCPTGTTLQITISDSTRLPASFTASSFVSDNEQGLLDICINVPVSDFTFLREVQFNFAATGVGNAGTLDIIVLNTFQTQTIGQSSPNMICRSATIITDNRVEEDEFLEVTLSGGDSIDLNGGNARLIITDDDVAEVSLVQQIVTVTEGDDGLTDVMMCVRLDSFEDGLDRDVDLLLNTDPLTTASPNDFVELNNAILTIPAGSPEGFTGSCATIQVVGDRFRENDETFAVDIEAVDSDDDIATRTFRITIQSESTDICEELENPPNGMVMPTGFTAGSIAMYSCNEGFVLSSTSPRICIQTGWSGSEPQCNIIDCGDPPQPANGNGMPAFTTTTFGSVATYTCNSGFMLSTGGMEFNRTCVAIPGSSLGEWSGSTPLCNRINCGNLLPPDDGRVSAPSTFFEDTAIYTCFNGFELSTGGDSFTRTCGSEAMWEPEAPTCERISCGPLNDPPNGAVSFAATTFSSEATYECNVGHELIGANTRICGGDGWSGEQPECRIFVCDALSNPANGTVSHAMTTFGSVATYSCLPGFSLTGPAERMCMDLGVWSGEAPECSNDICGPLDDPTNGNVAVMSSILDSVAVYTCNIGHSLSSQTENFTRICMAGGWSDSAPTCIPVDCGAPPAVSNASINTDQGTDFMSVAEYTCDGELTLVGLGGDSRVCEADGKWSSVDPTCEDLNPAIDTILTPGESIMEGMSIAFNCTATNIPDTLTSSVKITWTDDQGEVLLTSNGTLFLYLSLDNLKIDDSGTYFCTVEIESEFLPNNGFTINEEFVISVSATATAPLAPQNDNTNLIIGVVVGGGIGILLLILCVGSLMTCYLCLRKKKNYRKYVLPYRTYMDAYKSTSETIANPGATSSKTPANDIRQWENGRREHVLDAVDMLDRNGHSK